MKNIKNLAIYAVISVYIIGIVLSFSGNLINQIQVTRQKIQIEKIFNAEILEFSLTEWDNFEDFDEIKFRNKYYDVVSFQKINNRIFAKAVKDDFENEFRVSFLKVFNKHQSPFSKIKKTNFFCNHLLCFTDFKIVGNSNFKLDFIPYNKYFLAFKTSSFINFLEKPPREINFNLV